MPFAMAGAGVGAIGSIVGGGKQAKAIKQASQAQQQSAQAAMTQQQNQYNQTRQDLSPYFNAGDSALSQIMGELPDLTKGFNPAKYGVSQNFSYNPADVANDPAYQFAMQQGQLAISRQAAANGQAFGGATAKALDSFATGTAAQYENQDYNQAYNTHQSNYNNAFNEFTQGQNNAFSKLSAIAGMGSDAAARTGQFGAQNSAAISNLLTQQGNSQAAGVIGQANAGASMLGGVGANLSTLFNNPNFQNMLNGTQNMNGSSYAVDPNAPANGGGHF